jgi:hypothetical protein
MKFRKKALIVEAVRWNGANIREMLNFMPTDYVKEYGSVHHTYEIVIDTLEGQMKADIGDYIIKGVNGEFYPCKPDIFDKTYELVGQTEV